MSSPFSRETQKGTEETIEALKMASVWGSRIDTKNEATGIDAEFIDDLNEEENRLREKYKIKNTEVATDNFVFNNVDTVLKILSDDLDQKVSALHEFSEYVSNEFGYVSAPSLSKEEMIWLISEEVQKRKDYIEEYQDFSDDKLRNLGNTPNLWDGEEYPIYKK